MSSVLPRLILAATLLALASPVSAQFDPALEQGVADVGVFATNLDGGGRYQVGRTNGGGAFETRPLPASAPAGEYGLTVRCPDGRTCPTMTMVRVSQSLFPLRPLGRTNYRMTHAAGQQDRPVYGWVVASPADVEPAADRVLRDPDWVRQPRADDYPTDLPPASPELKSVTVTVHCSILDGGDLDRCVATNAGLDRAWQIAGVRMSRFFRHSDVLPNGRSTRFSTASPSR